MILTVAVATLTGCASLKSSRGGSITIEKTKTTITEPEDGPKVTVIEHTTATVEQPENAETPAQLTLPDDGTVNASTGMSQSVADITRAIGSNKMLIVLSIMGGLFIFAGVVSFIFLKSLPIAGGFGAAGIIIITLAYLLSAYSLYIMIGSGVLILGGIAFVLWRYGIFTKANQEHIELINNLKDELPEESREKYFKDGGIVDSIQSDYTKKIVKRYKK